jgi:hypothetical protein
MGNACVREQHRRVVNERVLEGSVTIDSVRVLRYKHRPLMRDGEKSRQVIEHEIRKRLETQLGRQRVQHVEYSTNLGYTESGMEKSDAGTDKREMQRATRRAGALQAGKMPAAVES